MVQKTTINKKKELLKSLARIAQEIKQITVKISYEGKTGHVGSCLSIVDLLTVLYFAKMNLTSANLDALDRDRFILSKGHAAAALYAVLYKKNIISDEILHSFAQDDGDLCEHPEITQKGVEMTSGSLGHGLAFGAGIAFGLKNKKLKGNVYVLISDGECGEGSIWEAALLCSRLKLDNLTLIIDYNKWQCFGKSAEISNLEPFDKKWKSFGWEVYTINGHNLKQILDTLNKIPGSKKKPTVIIANTVSGKGVSLIEDKLIGHYKVFSPQEFAVAIQELKNI